MKNIKHINTNDLKNTRYLLISINATFEITQQIFFMKNDENKMIFKIEHDNYDYLENNNFLNDFISIEEIENSSKCYLLEL